MHDGASEIRVIDPDGYNVFFQRFD